ncbi:hypothetical protein [Pedobacter hartonius]|uniref:Uncharacterized protein n=1 Tax=Pedobacter hartonius TaxID=425514 RepID=A0A1H3Z1Q9_9SPHI|nr:hypothetical protein [Pedobacter hartonius]SEA17783.1 hypothetical protein SAMN05443550_102210 [Pedobacter hartonius]
MMEKLDGITVVLIIPFLLFVAFIIGAIVRGLLVKDNYKIGLSSITGNVIIGIVAIMILKAVAG